MRMKQPGNKMDNNGNTMIAGVVLIAGDTGTRSYLSLWLYTILWLRGAVSTWFYMAIFCKYLVVNCTINLQPQSIIRR